MITINLTQTEIATALGVSKKRTEEVLRRLFLTSHIAPLPETLRVKIAQTEAEYSGQINCTKSLLTVQKRGWGDSKLKDKASVLAYIKTSAESLIDLSVWKNYTGPKAPEATGTSFEPVWVRHYPLPGKYAYYPPTLPPTDPA